MLYFCTTYSNFQMLPFVFFQNQTLPTVPSNGLSCVVWWVTTSSVTRGIALTLFNPQFTTLTSFCCLSNSSSLACDSSLTLHVCVYFPRVKSVSHCSCSLGWNPRIPQVIPFLMRESPSNLWKSSYLSTINSVQEISKESLCSWLRSREPKMFNYLISRCL